MIKLPIAVYVSRFKKGDQDAFRILYEETKTRAYYTILLIVKDKGDAEDLLQETYMKVYDKIESYQSGTHFSAWVNTIARNLALTFYQKNKKTTVQDIAENEILYGSFDEQFEEKAYLDHLMKHLSKEDQEIVLRHVILKEKHKDIAADLKMPLGTVTWRYQQALKKLREVASHEEN
jgi:RNA polymerase sigma-70 factor (ECF subfamily)